MGENIPHGKTGCFIKSILSVNAFLYQALRGTVTWLMWQIRFNGSYFKHVHYDDVTMGAIASQITSLTIVYSTVYSGADQSKHQSSASLAFVWGIHRGPVNSPHKWPVTRKMFPFDDVIMSAVFRAIYNEQDLFFFVCGDFHFKHKRVVGLSYLCNVNLILGKTSY